jgi:transposase-like protein
MLAGSTLSFWLVMTERFGFWAALRDVFLATREQRCWFHQIANVLNALPKSAQPGAKAALAEIWNAEDREHAEAAARSFVAEYGTWSNVPTNQEAISKSLTRQSAGLDYCSCAREGAPDEC